MELKMKYNKNRKYKKGLLYEDGNDRIEILKQRLSILNEIKDLRLEVLKLKIENEKIKSRK